MNETIKTKQLLVYFARHKIQKSIVSNLSKDLLADTFEVQPAVNLKGIQGLFVANKYIKERTLLPILKPSINLSQYDSFIFVVPIYKTTIDLAVLSFMVYAKQHIKNVEYVLVSNTGSEVVTAEHIKSLNNACGKEAKKIAFYECSFFWIKIIGNKNLKNN